MYISTMIAGDCCWRRAKSLTSPERRFGYHIRVLLGASTSLPSGDYLDRFFLNYLFQKVLFFLLDTQLHIGREELYCHFPPPNWPYNTYDVRKTSKNWIKCSRQQIDFLRNWKQKIIKGVFLWLEMLVPILVTHSPVGHYDSTTHEFQLTLSFLPKFIVRCHYA